MREALPVAAGVRKSLTRDVRAPFVEAYYRRIGACSRNRACGRPAATPKAPRAKVRSGGAHQPRRNTLEGRSGSRLYYRIIGACNRNRACRRPAAIPKALRAKLRSCGLRLARLITSDVSSMSLWTRRFIAALGLVIEIDHLSNHTHSSRARAANITKSN